MNGSSFWKLFRIETVKVGLESSTKPTVLAELLDVTIAAGHLGEGARPALLKALIEREKIGSTGVGHGIAIPHVKSAAVKEVVTAVGIARTPLEYQAVDGEPVDLFFLLVSPSSEAQSHLETLRWLSRLVRHPDFGRFMRSARTPKDVVGLFKEMGED